MDRYVVARALEVHSGVMAIKLRTYTEHENAFSSKVPQLLFGFAIANKLRKNIGALQIELFFCCNSVMKDVTKVVIAEHMHLDPSSQLQSQA